MAIKSDRDTFRTLHDETAKAIRRGEKFARSLKRVIAQRNPDTSLQPFLKAVEKGLVTLGTEADELERLGWPKKAVEKTRGKSKPATETPNGETKAKAKAGGKALKVRTKGTIAKTESQSSPQGA
jgi:hypothetical protein